MFSVIKRISVCKFIIEDDYLKMKARELINLNKTMIKKIIAFANEWELMITNIFINYSIFA